MTERRTDGMTDSRIDGFADSGLTDWPIDGLGVWGGLAWGAWGGLWGPGGCWVGRITEGLGGPGAALDGLEALRDRGGRKRRSGLTFFSVWVLAIF